MYYDDEARRFNFVSGLLLGSFLGAGLALVARPPKRFRKPRRIRSGYSRARGGAARLTGGVADALSAAVHLTQRVGR
ncbi:hypothetical protein BH23GEM6_BH23GEM6_27050 [soil metagenome]